MKPKTGEDVEVRRILDDLTAYFSRQPGYLGGYRIDAHDGTGLVGRITTWTDEAAADHAAQTDHVLAIRSQLNQVVEEGSHEERAFQGTEVPAAG